MYLSPMLTVLLFISVVIRETGHVTVILSIDAFHVDFQTCFCLCCQSVVLAIRLTALFNQMNRTEVWKVS